MLALVLFDLVTPTVPVSPAITPFAIGRTETSPPFASTIALVLLVDKKPALVAGDGGRNEMADPQSGQTDFWRFRVAGLDVGILAPIPIEGFRLALRESSACVASCDDSSV
jgi:hypothetical protein